MISIKFWIHGYTICWVSEILIFGPTDTWPKYPPFWFFGVCRSYICTRLCKRQFFQMTQLKSKSEQLEWGFWKTLGNSPHPKCYLPCCSDVNQKQKKKINRTLKETVIVWEMCSKLTGNKLDGVIWREPSLSTYNFTKSEFLNRCFLWNFPKLPEHSF